MYCILVAGMPASGKSTIAGRISATMGIPMLSKDAIKEILYDDLGFKSREEKVQLGIAAMLFCGHPFCFHLRHKHSRLYFYRLT